MDGDTIIHFKPEVRERMTFTGGDSLNVTDEGKNPYVIARPLDDPSWMSMPRGFGDVLYVTSASDLEDRMETAPHDAMYIEAQYHHGVGPSDILEIVFTSPPGPRLAKRLDSLGIPWKTVQ